MNRSFYAVPAFFCVTAAIVTAQAPTPEKPANYPPATQQPTTQQPATPRPTTPPTSAQQPGGPSETSTMATNKVTYSGCIKPGTTTGTWVLENAEVAQKAGSSMPSTVGTSGSGSKMAFNLDPAATVNLKAHANHKVEVVGMLSPAKAHADSTASAAPAAGAAVTAGAHAAHQQFSVESVKMVSATCP